MIKGVQEISREARNCHIAISAEQEKLSAQWLEPVIPELLKITRRHRAEFDAHFRCSAPTSLIPVATDENHHSYPIGYCELICNGVWDRLAREPLVADLVSKGLIWKKVFFIQHGQFFQNAIQCGSYLLDPANDSAFRHKEPVVCDPLSSFKHEKLNDWQRYIEIAESYLELRLVPNRYFPIVLPLAPFLAITPAGRVRLLLHQDFLFRLDMSEDWKRTRALVASRWWETHRLDPKDEAALAAFCQSQPAMPLRFDPCGESGFSKHLREWSAIVKSPSAEFHRVTTAVVESINSTASRMHESTLRISG